MAPRPARTSASSARAVSPGSRCTSTVTSLLIVASLSKEVSEWGVGGAVGGERGDRAIGALRPARLVVGGFGRDHRAASEQRVADARGVHDRTVGEQQVEPAG